MSNKITGKIAAIVDDKHVLINRGKNHDVRIGQRFVILLVLPEVTDPDDPAIRFPGLRLTKGHLRVANAFDAMSFCALVPKQESSLSSLFGGNFGGRMEVYPKVAESEAMVSDEDYMIQVGDVVSLDEEEKKT